MAPPVRLQYTKRRQDPLDRPPRCRPGVRAGVPGRAAAARVQRGLLAAPEGELRACAVDRPRERRRSTSTSCLPTTSTSTRLLAPAHRGVARGDRDRGRGPRSSIGHRPARGGHRAWRGRSRSVSAAPDARDAHRRRGWPRPQLPTDAAAQGPRRHRRRSTGHPASRVRDSTRRATDGRDGTVNPTAQREAGRGPRRQSAGFTEVRALRTHQWIERDGARLEPLDADTRPRMLEEARVCERRHRCQTLERLEDETQRTGARRRRRPP